MYAMLEREASFGARRVGRAARALAKSADELALIARPEREVGRAGPASCWALDTKNLPNGASRL